MSGSGAVPDRPAITVVIPAYRARRTIRRAVDSVLAQGEVDARAVVVIDGKLDDTAERLADYPPGLVSVVQQQTNVGASVSRNSGLQRADTEFVMFLDSDDVIEGPLLIGLVDAMGASGADVGFGPMQILQESTGRRGPRSIPDFVSAEEAFRRWHLEGIFVPTCSVLWRTEFVRSIGGWDAELTRNDDGELVNRALLRGARIAVSARGCGIYVKHSMDSLNNRTDNMDSMLWANERLLAIERPALSPELRDHVCAGHYFNIAWHSYLSGRDDLGDVALRRSRAMGFKGRGPVHYRLAALLIGPKRTCRLIARLKAGTAPVLGRARAAP